MKDLKRNGLIDRESNIVTDGEYNRKKHMTSSHYQQSEYFNRPTNVDSNELAKSIDYIDA